MNDRKHIVVGLFVLGGLIGLGTLIIWFEGVSHLIRGGYEVRAHLPTAKGIRTGKRVHLDGIEIGDVTDITSNQPDRPGVWVHMRINPEDRIPREAKFVAQQTMTGDVFLDFESPDETVGWRPTDGSATVEGKLKPPSLLPEDVMQQVYDAMRKIEDVETLVANLTELTEPRSLKDVDQGKRRNLWTTLAQIEVTAASVEDQLTGKDTEKGLGRLLVQANTAADELQKTLKQAQTTLTKADKALATAGEAGKTVADLGKKAEGMMTKGDALLAKLSKTADGADALVANLNAAVTDVREGKGTAGKLMTDDELHQALVTLIRSLKEMSDNADRLLTMWRKEGILSKE
jgi:phospholipid/cholesterol/gamma-HCH transport system substrate-binding protein